MFCCPDLSEFSKCVCSQKAIGLPGMSTAAFQWVAVPNEATLVPLSHACPFSPGGYEGIAGNTQLSSLSIPAPVP